VGQVWGSMVFARESRDQASVAQRSRSSLAGMLLGGLILAPVRNLTRSPGDGTGILAAVQSFPNVAGAMMLESKKHGAS
jgi:hypothetical protein